jgi:hypothetical protein
VASNYVTNVFERDPAGGDRYLLCAHTSSLHPGAPSAAQRKVPARQRATYKVRLHCSLLHLFVARIAGCLRGCNGSVL